MKNFITPHQLDQLDDVVIFDVRHDFKDLDYGRRAYEKEHLHGAFFLDLESDLSSAETDQSGRHPLPEAKDFKSWKEPARPMTRSLWYMMRDRTERPGVPGLS